MYFRFVSENADPGTVVLRIGAFDVDDVSSGISSNFEYTMLLQQPPTLGFTVDSGTGDIKVGSLGLNRALVSSYNLTISVSDKGNLFLNFLPSLFSWLWQTILILIA